MDIEIFEKKNTAERWAFLYINEKRKKKNKEKYDANL